jgi:hypothetical protein
MPNTAWHVSGWNPPLATHAWRNCQSLRCGYSATTKRALRWWYLGRWVYRRQRHTTPNAGSAMSASELASVTWASEGHYWNYGFFARVSRAAGYHPAWRSIISAPLPYLSTLAVLRSRLHERTSPDTLRLWYVAAQASRSSLLQERWHRTDSLDCTFE